MNLRSKMTAEGTVLRTRRTVEAISLDSNDAAGSKVRLGIGVELTVDSYDRADPTVGIWTGSLYVTDDLGHQWEIVDDGTLWVDFEEERCERCDGHGQAVGTDPDDVDCWACGGDGVIYCEVPGALVPAGS